MRYLCGVLACALGAVSSAAEAVGARPYELEWAGRTEDDHPPLVGFEDDLEWTVSAEDAEARFERTREQQIWGRSVGKLTYRGTGPRPVVRIVPASPLRVRAGFDAVSCWIYGNNWAWVTDRSTPQVEVKLLFDAADGSRVTVSLARVRWKEWFLCHRRLTGRDAEALAAGGAFVGIEVAGGRNSEDRVLYFDNVAVFREEFPALEFEPRPERGIAMLPGQGTGTNTGPGKLPFPTREETILPAGATPGSSSGCRRDGAAFVFEYRGEDGILTYRYEPASGTWDDIVAAWEGCGGPFSPLSDGGIRLAGEEGRALPPTTLRPLGAAALEEDTVTSRWLAEADGVKAEVTYRLRLWGKSLVVDTISRGGHVAEVRYGRARDLENPRLVTLPYYDYGGSRPAIVVAGEADSPLFLSGHTDWTLSNGSVPWAENDVSAQAGVAYQGGVRYTPRTDGLRNDCYERFFLTVSPRFEETLPVIPNPVSPWKRVTGSGVWRAHGASDRQRDREFWRRAHRHGMRHVIVTDHETGWRDGGESFTFRTRAAPGKGGDEGQYTYARFMQDELGFVYGPYNNFTDFAPVNEFWTPDLISRTPENQLQGAWARCYAPKPARAVEYCARLAPRIQEKFRFSTAYCDVHTAVTPWGRVDYDARVPGAGTFAAVFYSFGEIMLLQKQAWGGPVYSEGGKHAFYCGLTDGNYAQDQAYRIPYNPWLVDFDLLRLHDLCCNFGMGNPGMFYGERKGLGGNAAEVERSVDRFLAATVAFGHPGFLVFEGGYRNALRSYYMVQQLASRYTQASAVSIRYVDADGVQRDTSSALASGAFRRSQVVVRYSDGTVVVANGHETDVLRTQVDGRALELPPAGYAGWTADGAIEVYSGLVQGRRCDYARTPEYTFLDGRGAETRFPAAAGSGLSVCRGTDGGWEVIPYEGSDCGFAVDAASAVALDYDGRELGPAELRRSRGLTFVLPVPGAFRYRLAAGASAAGVALTSPRTEAVPGETVSVRGARPHQVRVPEDAVAGERFWAQCEGAWIDFPVVPLAEITARLRGDVFAAALRSNLADPAEARVALAGQEQRVTLVPGEETSASFDLGPARGEDFGALALSVASGGLRCSREWGMTVRQGHLPLALPEHFRAGMREGDGEETFALGMSGASASLRDELVCGGVTRSGWFMHPPWQGGAYGLVFALLDPVTLPREPRAAFRAEVGKLDGSDLGDGIW
ncbi:MAG: hypothetical protein JXR77_00525, partial [Lentisphaeria bacterium]|nr:hypothetical protein [Lentisphaeria bacterium]